MYNAEQRLQKLNTIRAQVSQLKHNMYTAYNYFLLYTFANGMKTKRVSECSDWWRVK